VSVDVEEGSLYESLLVAEEFSELYEKASPRLQAYLDELRELAYEARWAELRSSLAGAAGGKASVGQYDKKRVERSREIVGAAKELLESSCDRATTLKHLVGCVADELEMRTPADSKFILKVLRVSGILPPPKRRAPRK
jgi:hypothetical protein